MLAPRGSPASPEHIVALLGGLYDPEPVRDGPSPQQAIPEGIAPDLAAIPWVDERATMADNARAYQNGANGRALERRDAPSQAPMVNGVRFDGADGATLIDRKLAVLRTAKAQRQAQRQAAALQQCGLTGRWEVPSATEARRAQKLFSQAGVAGLDVKVVEPDES